MMLAHDWEFNVLGIYNFRKAGKLDAYYDWLRKNHARVPGDVLEAGVFKGKSLLATALLLKELGSDKRVFGYDSFSGFPPVYHDNDRIEMFEQLLRDGRITAAHMKAHSKLVAHREFLKDTRIDVRTISSSEEFSQAGHAAILRKADYLGLDNIVLVPGDFASTMGEQGPATDGALCACLVDCDLYASYVTTLNHVWPRLSKGGLMFLDEYFSLKFAGARIACDEFFCDKMQKPQRLSSTDDDFFERWGVVK